jgi:hypothetical protein
MIRVAPFKDDGPVQYKMLKATLYLQRKAGVPGTDDVLRIYEDDEYVEMYRLVYETPELKRVQQFYMSRHLVCDYLSDFLTSLRFDSDPFEHVQVSTAIHPSILYHISDLDNCRVRHLVEDTILMAMRTPVQNLKRKD